jgi:hypothetical protein
MLTKDTPDDVDELLTQKVGKLSMSYKRRTIVLCRGGDGKQHRKFTS